MKRRNVTEMLKVSAAVFVRTTLTPMQEAEHHEATSELRRGGRQPTRRRPDSLRTNRTHNSEPHARPLRDHPGAQRSGVDGACRKCSPLLDHPGPAGAR